MRHVENLSDIKHEVVHICEPEIGITLSDEEGISQDLMNCQEERGENSYFQVRNEMILNEDLIDF